MRTVRSGRRWRCCLLLVGVVGALAVLAGTVTGAARADGGTIGATPSNLVFSGVPGEPAGPLSLWVTNTGATSVMIDAVEVLATTEFAVWPAGTCVTGLLLGAGASCSADAVFVPTGTAPATGTLRVKTSEGMAIAGLFGNGAVPGGGGPAVTATPLSLDFGMVAAGTTSSILPVRIQNSSASMQQITGLAVAGNPGFAFAVTPALPVALAPDSFFDVFLEFAAGPDTSPAYGEATIATTADPLVVALYANGAAPGGGGGGGDGPTTAMLSPADIGAGHTLVGTTSLPFTLTLENTGPNMLILSAPPALPEHYALAGGTCGLAPLAPAATCTLDVTFTPVAFGSANGPLEVFFNGGSVVANLWSDGVVLQPGAGSAGGGYVVAPGMANVERNRDRFEWAFRAKGDGLVRGKVFTYRWWVGAQAYVARLQPEAVERYGLVVDGSTAFFDGQAQVALVNGAVETPVAGMYRLKVLSWDNANPSGAGADQIAVLLYDESGKTMLHQTGDPGAPATLASGNIGNAYPWTF